jgi:hypothetical protein
MLILFSLFKGEKEKKLEFFFKISSDFLSPESEDKVSTARLSKLLRFYLEYTLIFYTRIAINIHSTLKKETINLARKQRLFSNYTNMTTFLTTISPFLSPAHDDTEISLDLAKSTLRNYIFLFDFFEIRRQFLAIIKENPENKAESINFSSFAFSDLEEGMI